MKRKKENATARSRFHRGTATGKYLKIACGIVMLSVNLCLAKDIDIQAASNRENIYLGESFDLTLQVSGIRTRIQPDLSALKDCSIKYLGSEDRSYRNEISINGRRQVHEFQGRLYAYRITPSSIGEFTAGPISITVKGKTARTTGPKLKVIGIEKQESVLLSISASKDTVLVDEPFDITITVAIKRLSGKYAHLDPLISNEPPRLYSPHLDPLDTEGLEMPDLAKVMEKHLAKNQEQNTGFIINNYTLSQNPMDRFFSIGPAEVDKPAKITFPRIENTYSGQKYFEYSLTLRYLPRTEGSHVFGPTTFKGKIIDDITPAGHQASKPIFAVGQAVTVRVVPPPEENRPKTYIGAVGPELTAKAELDTQTCRVSDPLTLDLTVSGDINLENISQPDLSLQSQLHDNFKIYDDNVEILNKDKEKIFRYTLRPLRAGTQEFPPVKLSYYDTDDREYKTIHTEAIPIRVNATTRIIKEDILSTATNTIEKTIGRIGSSMVAAPISMDPSGFIHQPIRLSWRQGVMMGTGPAVYFLILSISFIRRKTSRDPVQERSKKALQTAIRLIKGKNEDRITKAMIQFVADRLGKNPSGMTPLDVRALLESKNTPEDLIDRYSGALQENFNRTYKEAPESEAEAKEESKRIIALMEEIDHTIPHKGNNNRTSSSRLIITLLVLTGVSILPQTSKATGVEIEREFIWNQALSRVQRSNTQKDFLEAASIYSRLIERRTINGHVFFNAATAYLLADEYDNAIKNLIRAERHLGSSWAIRRNMLLAMSRGKETEETPLPWSRLLFFWHFGLSAMVRMNIAVISFSMIWIGLAAIRIGLRRTGKVVVVISLIVFALFGSSIADSMHKEAKAVEYSKTVSPEEMET